MSALLKHQKFWDKERERRLPSRETKISSGVLCRGPTSEVLLAIFCFVLIPDAELWKLAAGNEGLGLG